MSLSGAILGRALGAHKQSATILPIGVEISAMGHYNHLWVKASLFIAKGEMMDEIFPTFVRSCAQDSLPFPAREFFSQIWLLRRVLDWFSKHIVERHVLGFSGNACWFSYGRLPNPLGEPVLTDGVIGDIAVDENENGLLSLRFNALDFTVVRGALADLVGLEEEADRLAKTVVGMAQALHSGKRRPDEMDRLGFCYLFPERRMAELDVEGLLDSQRIADRVEEWIQISQNVGQDWYKDCFQSVLDYLSLSVSSWEQVLDEISEQDPTEGDRLNRFYECCLRVADLLREEDS